MNDVGWTPRVLAGIATAVILGLAPLLAFRTGRRRVVPVGLVLLASLPLLHELWLWAGAITVPWIHVSSAHAAGLVLAGVAAAAFQVGSLAVQGPARRFLVELLVSTALLACALAALDLRAAQHVTKQALVLVLDRSRSMDLVPDADGRLHDELRVAELGMHRDDLIGVVGFASGAVLEEPLRTSTSLSSPSVPELVRDSTDLEAGIRRALAELPEDAAPRLAILSDGAATTGDAESAAMGAVALGVPIDVVPLEHRAAPNIAVTSLRTSASVSEGEPIELKVALRSTTPCHVSLEIRLDGSVVGTAPVELRSGEGLVRLSQPNPGPGLHRFDVTLGGVPHRLDATTGDNSGSAHVRVRGRAAALVLEATPERGSPMQQALRAAGFDVATASTLTAPTSLGELARFDLVVQSGIPAVAFSPDQLTALAAFVTSLGGGLLLMGGDMALGPGGYGSTPLEAISPVSFDLKQERRRASLTEVIAIDYSGSMSAEVGGKTKLQLANEAAVQSLSLLSRGDRIGVAHVDTAVRWTVPVAAIAPSEEISRQIRAVSPSGGGIAVDTALRGAFAALAKEQTQLKHLLLFADGDDATEREMAPDLVGRAYAAGTTTSVVALGRGKDIASLERLSQIGHGRFYLVEDATRLPAVFAQETVLASRSAIAEGSFRATRSASPAALRGIDIGAAPPLLGYVVTLPKPSAEIWLAAPDSDPLLAIGRSGLGQVAVFSSDYEGRWGREWLAWPSAATLFAQLGRSLMRSPDDVLVSLRTSPTAGGLELEATVVSEDGRLDNGRVLEALVVSPGHAEERHQLAPSASGVYRAEIPTGAPGTYTVSLVDAADNRQLAATAVVIDAREELSSTHSDRRLLRRIAELTGGTERDTLAGIFDERRTAVASFASLVDSLLLLAAVTFVLSVAARRIVLPDAIQDRWRRLRDALHRGRTAEDAHPSPPGAGSLAPSGPGSVSGHYSRKTKGRDDTVAPAREETSPAITTSAGPQQAEAARDASPSAPVQGRHGVAEQQSTGNGGSRSTLDVLLERRRGRRPQ